MKPLRISVLLLSLLALSIGAAAALGADRHVNATLTEVNGSGVSGRVMLTSLPQGGTLITVSVAGLSPGTAYVSLYYENHTCELEPYSEDDVINRYTAGPGGRATFTKKVADDLDEINSVSVRLAEGFALQACADTHP
jgi:hypothetical protein